MKTKKRNFSKMILLIVATCFLAVLLFSFTACDKIYGRYSEMEHIANVKERIEKRFMTGEYEVTSFEVYPLYTENEQLKYLLVEFEPCGYLYISIDTDYNAFLEAIGLGRSLYQINNAEGGVSLSSTWRRYTFGADTTEQIYEVDSEGNYIYYNVSPFKAANVLSERMYLLYSHFNGYIPGSSYIPAVKREGEFLNLISMETIDDLTEAVPTIEGLGWYCHDESSTLKK